MCSKGTAEMNCSFHHIVAMAVFLVGEMKKQ